MKRALLAMLCLGAPWAFSLAASDAPERAASTPRAPGQAAHGKAASAPNASTPEKNREQNPERNLETTAAKPGRAAAGAGSAKVNTPRRYGAAAAPTTGAVRNSDGQLRSALQAQVRHRPVTVRPKQSVAARSSSPLQAVSNGSDRAASRGAVALMTHGRASPVVAEAARRSALGGPAARVGAASIGGPAARLGGATIGGPATGRGPHNSVIDGRQMPHRQF